MKKCVRKCLMLGALMFILTSATGCLEGQGSGDGGGSYGTPDLPGGGGIYKMPEPTTMSMLLAEIVGIGTCCVLRKRRHKQ
jgi:hypothetical protein